MVQTVKEKRMALTAKKVYAILKRQISDMEAKLNSPVRYRGTVATADLLPLNPDIGDMYNIESKSIYGEAGMNVAWNGVVWDTMGAPIDMSLYFTKEEAEAVIQRLVTEYFEKNPVKPGATAEQVQQIEQNKTDIGSLKEDLGNKAPAIIKKALGKTIIINDSSNLPVKILSGTGKIIITGKNILDSKKRNEFIPFEAKAGTLFTLITNGELSEGGNIKFTKENGEQAWFAIDKGKTKTSAKISSNIKGYVNLLVPKEGLEYCFSVGENDEYEEHMEQVITAPVDSEQLKAIHTNYPTTILTSENEISVQYVVDTEAYIEKRIKEENQSLQKQILEIQNALISQKISGV